MCNSSQKTLTKVLTEIEKTRVNRASGEEVAADVLVIRKASGDPQGELQILERKGSPGVPVEGCSCLEI